MDILEWGDKYDNSTVKSIENIDVARTNNNDNKVRYKSHNIHEWIAYQALHQRLSIFPPSFWPLSFMYVYKFCIYVCIILYIITYICISQFSPGYIIFFLTV